MKKDDFKRVISILKIMQPITVVSSGKIERHGYFRGITPKGYLKLLTAVIPKTKFKESQNHGGFISEEIAVQHLGEKPIRQCMYLHHHRILKIKDVDPKILERLKESEQLKEEFWKNLGYFMELMKSRFLEKEKEKGDSWATVPVDQLRQLLYDQMTVTEASAGMPDELKQLMDTANRCIVVAMRIHNIDEPVHW